MKRLIHYFIALILFAFTTSCKKSFLDVEDNTTILRQQYVIDLNTTQEFLNGIYVVLARNIYNQSYQPYPEVVADNVKPNSARPVFVDHYNWNQATTSSNMNGQWQTGYQIIRSCSFVIAKTNELSGENPAKARQLQAEALCLRALVNFILVNTFAQSYHFTQNGSHPGIPYITSSDWNDPFSRNTVAEVYAGMISDLTAAITLFAGPATNILTMNQHAAKALLARIYLFQENWQQAESLAKEVTNAIPLMTGSAYPSKLFTHQETEAIFQLAPSSTKLNAGSYDTRFQGRLYVIPGLWATRDIANLIRQNPNDSRSKWFSPDGMGNDSIVKFPRNVVPGFGTDIESQSWNYYQTILRSSEMFLTVAEAAAKRGDENTARTYLDAIRQRADPTANNSTATGNALLDSIYLERRKELAFEGLRMYDLQRWKKDVNRIDVTTGSPTILPYSSDKAIAPIPAIDVANGIPQNPGY